MKSPVVSLLILLLLSLASVVLGQEHPAVTAQPNTVYVGADGKFEADPDTAVLQFNISAQENNSRDAYDHASKDAEQIRQILRSNGIEPKSAQISTFSIQPVFDYKAAKRKVVAYQVNASVSLKLKDFTKIAAIVQQLSDTDITDQESINYTLENMDAAKTKAVDDAYRHARASAEALAAAGGRSLGELSYAAVDVSENPRIVPLARAMQAIAGMAKSPAPTEGFTPQTISVTAHVNAVFTLK